MRILRIADVPRTEAAGVSGVILHSGEALAELGHHVEYLFGEDLIARRLPPWLRFLLIPAAICVRVNQHVRRSSLDVVEIHRPSASLYAPLARNKVFRRRLPPCVLQCQGLEELWWKTMRTCWARANVPTSWRKRIIFRFLIGQARLASRYASAIVVPTEADVRHLVDVLGIDPQRVSVAHNGVESVFFDIQRDLAPSELRVLYFGSWLDRKGAPDMVDAWSLVNERWPSASLTIAGSGHAATEVRQSFEPPHRDSVKVLPYVSRAAVPDLLSRHDVLVLPSWYEGMPLAVLESAAAGMAVVATRIAGNVEIFREPDSEQDGAILVDIQSPIELAAAVCRLVEDRVLLSALQQRARKRASLFTWDSSARSFADAYETAVSSGA